MNSAPVDVASVRYPGERPAFFVLLFASLITLAAIGAVAATRNPAVWVFLLYIGMFVAFGWLAKVFLLASIRGHGVKVSAEQYPEIHKYVQDFAGRLGLKQLPEVYVIQNTLMNAFATKAIGRKYVVLYSSLVDAALESGDYGEVAMIVGHEMAHHAAGHVRWYRLLQFGLWVPFLYMFWSRRAEYTCDRVGFLLVQDVKPALQGILKLSVGRKLAAGTNFSALRQQREIVSREFGPKIVEIFSTHPLTIKRLIEIEDYARGRVSG